MRMTFSSTAIERAPAEFTRLRLTNEPRGTKRLVREGTATWLELGAGSDLTRRKFILLARSIIRTAREHKLKKLAIDFSKSPELFANVQDISPEELSTLTATAFEMANYEPTTYKTKPKEGWPMVEEVLLLSPADAGIKAAVKRGQAIGQAVNECRELANTPGGDMTPKLLAAAAKQAAKGTKATVKVLGRKEMEKLGMGAILGMAKGSAEEPQFIIVEYWGAGRPTPRGPLGNLAPIVLVGKGVTFDMGGLNIKTGDHMYEMHMDMSGGAAAIHATVLAAKLGVKRNVVALVPSVENALSHNAVRPGDILQSLSGKTIEILNTDAEGRVIIADGITYAKRYNPALLVDIGTFTGGAVAGSYASPFATNEVRWSITDYLRMSEESGDYTWPVPLWDELDFIAKGTFGDVPNIPTAKDRGLYTVSVGKFLEVFVKDLNCPWLHLDIGARMTATSDEYLAKGAAGAPVRLLLTLIENAI